MGAGPPGSMQDVRNIASRMEPQIDAFSQEIARAKIEMSESELVILSVFELALANYQRSQAALAADEVGDETRVASVRAEAADSLRVVYPAQASEIMAAGDTKALVESLWEIGSTLVGAAQFTIEQQTGNTLPSLPR